MQFRWLLTVIDNHITESCFTAAVNRRTLALLTYNKSADCAMGPNVRLYRRKAERFVASSQVIYWYMSVGVTLCKILMGVIKTGGREQYNITG